MALSTSQKIVGYSGAAVSAAAIVVSFLHKPLVAKATAALGSALGAAALGMAGLQMSKTRLLVPAPGGQLDQSNSAALGTLAFGSGALLASALALLITPSSCKAPKALGCARRRR